MIEQASLVIGEGNWAVKSDSLLGYKINGGKYYPREMSVVRATTGTRINEDGLVELVPYNLVRFSEDFSNAAWSKANSASSSIPIVTANYGVSPDGTQNADRVQLTRGAANNDYAYIENPTNVTNGSVYTFSVYLKSLSGSATLCIGYNGSSYSFSQITITEDWQRYTITTTVSNSIVYPTIGILGTTYATSNSTSIDILAWGFQLVEGSSALDYLPTTDRLDVARIDYSSGSGALLVEPQRTNLVTYSSSFDNAAWIKSNATISANTIASPSGIQDADSIIENTATGIHIFYQGPIAASSGIYTTSMFFKKNTRQYAFLQIAVNGAADRFTAVIDLNNGNVTDTTTVGSPTSTSYTTEDFGNGWYRLTVSAQQNGGNVFLVSGLSDSATPTYNVTGEPNYTGNGTGSVYAWGAQLEAGSYPTSLIPTQAATVTRNADVISKTGIADLIGQTEGTLFGEVQFTAGSFSSGLIIRDTAFNAFAYINQQVSGKLYGQLQGIASIQIQSSTLTNGRYKIAFAYKSGDSAFYINGQLIGTSSATYTNTFNISIFDISLDPSILYAAALYKTRLTNAELATLTTI